MFLEPSSVLAHLKRRCCVLLSSLTDHWQEANKGGVGQDAG